MSRSSTAGNIAAWSLVGDARATLQELLDHLSGYRVPASFASQIAAERQTWQQEVDRIRGTRLKPIPSQAEVIGVINDFVGPKDVVVSAAGSLPGDLHKLWRCHDPKAYHMEYGYSCMGYEIPAAIGVKLADPSRNVYAIIGDGNYLMMSQEIVTAIQEGVKINVIVLDNHGFASIGGLSQSLGCQRFGTRLQVRGEDGRICGADLPIRFDQNAASLGANALHVSGISELLPALDNARNTDRVSVIVIETDIESGVPGYETWWDVPICEVSESESVQRAREKYDQQRPQERDFLNSP